jgi:universal stress protein E
VKLLEKIMLATDFSPAAQQAFRVTLNLAGAFHSEIILLHVLPEIEDYSQTMDFLKREAARELAAMQEQIKQKGIEASNVITTPGDPFEQITRHAEDLNVNLVILGAGEKEAGDRVQLGITAERVIRDSHKPVWVVRQGGTADIEKVLCPVDFSDSSQRALYTAIHLCRQFRSTLTVLTVVPSLSSLGRGMGSVAEKEQKGLEKSVQSRFEEFLSQFDFHNVSWQKRVSQGKPHREIISAVADGRFDLIIMGTAGRRGLAKFLIGSVTEKVIRELPVSIITVKSEHAIRLHMEAEIEDIQSHLKRGRDLLEKGFPREAVDEFEACIEKDMMFAPAWEALAEAHQRLGNERIARDCREKARMIRESLWAKQVVADARKEVLGKKV